MIEGNSHLRKVTVTWRGASQSWRRLDHELAKEHEGAKREDHEGATTSIYAREPSRFRASWSSRSFAASCSRAVEVQPDCTPSAVFALACKEMPSLVPTCESCPHPVANITAQYDAYHVSILDFMVSCPCEQINLIWTTLSLVPDARRRGIQGLVFPEHREGETFNATPSHPNAARGRPG